jgi:signal transduction histidine kinase
MSRGAGEAARKVPWTGVRWWRIDVALALVVAAGQVGGTLAVTRHQPGTVTPFAVVLLALGAGSLVFRSRHPVVVLWATFATTLWYWSAPYPRGPVFVSLLVAFGSCLIIGHRSSAWVALAAGYVAFAWLPAALGTHPGPSTLVALALAAWLAVLASVFEGLRLTRLRVAADARSRADEDRRRASEERLRIAHDLHDALAHHISLISVQATTGIHLFDRQPEEARAALANIRVVSRQALGELRSVLDVLRSSEAPSTLAPALGLDQLEELVTLAGAAGLTVDLVRRGSVRAIPDSVATAGYRIVQEALTNITRHSGASSAVVQVNCGDDGLIVEIDDPGPGRGPAPRSSDGSGRGLAGMRERVESLGGRLLAGPRPEGGFRVRAQLPTEGTRLPTEGTRR